MDELERLKAEVRHWQELANGVIAFELKLRVELELMATENWQLKGALGYEVPSHIKEGKFKCGLCNAKKRDADHYQDLFEQAQAAHEATLARFEKRLRRKTKKAAAEQMQQVA